MIPAELNEKNKRFNVSDVEKGARYDRIKDDFLWLTATTKSRMTELEEEIDILNGKILAEESKESNLLTREQIVDFLTILPEQEPQLIIDAMIRKVDVYDDKLEIHYNFSKLPELDDPDGLLPEDRRVFSVSFQSNLSSSVPPYRNNSNRCYKNNPGE